MDIKKRVYHKFLKERIQERGSLRITVSGISMYPILIEGDEVIISSSESINIGDIIVFLHYGSLLIHRVLEQHEKGFLCKGDNAFDVEKIVFSQVLGKVISINGIDATPCPSWLIHSSKRINCLYEKFNHDTNSVRMDNEYLNFKKMISTLYDIENRKWINND